MRDTAGRLRIFELIFDVAIFAVCAVVCVLLLGKARQMSAESAQLTRAVELSQNAAETWKATGELPVGGGMPDGDGYAVVLTPDGEGVDVAVSRNGTPVYTIEGVRRNG